MTPPKPGTPPPSVPSTAYTREYFERGCQGYAEFNATQGRELPLRLSIPLSLAGVQPGMRVVDVGCGRGEIALHCAQRGARVWGLDYAAEGLDLARQAVAGLADADTRGRIVLQQANARQLPLASNSADLAFMLDVVEHLYPHELAEALAEVYRVLRPGGRLVAHTMPNLWYYRFGYPLYRGLQRLRGQKLPADPRDRWPFRHVHVNEQTPRQLRLAMSAQGFRTRVWLATTQSYEYEPSVWVRRGMEFLTRVPPFRWVFCNDIFAVGRKRPD